jgi:hypothetical protein
LPVNLNLFLAGLWAIVGGGILMLPLKDDAGFLAITRDNRSLIGSFALVLACYNVLRWRFTRIRRQLDKEAQSYRPTLSRHRREEPPNPDFDFSDQDTDKPPPS